MSEGIIVYQGVVVHRGSIEPGVIYILFILFVHIVAAVWLIVTRIFISNEKTKILFKTNFF